MGRFLTGFVHAGRGIALAFAGELNIKVMVLMAAGAVAWGWYRGLSSSQWALITFCIGLVLSLEILNTAAERLVDILSPGHDPRYGRIKDLTAGAVLIASIAAAVVGLLVFLA
jgi:diacylglycerol kinase (ATP)